MVMPVHEKSMNGDEGKGNKKERLFCVRHYGFIECIDFI
jgi:hypothetical protein